MEGIQALPRLTGANHPATSLRPIRLLMAGSGSGGHMLPALAIADLLRHQGYQLQVTFCTEDRAALRKLLLPQLHRDDQVVWQPESSLAQTVWNTLKQTLTPCRANVAQPDLVIGMGGRAMLPWLAWAKTQRLPSLVFEANTSAGLAVNWGHLWSQNLASQWMLNSPSRYSCHRVTGMPLPQQLANSLRHGMPISQRHSVLITAGSQGSIQLSRMAARALCLHNDLLSGWTVYHQAPERDCQAIKSLYDEYGIDAVVKPQFLSLKTLLPQAGLAISRAGACSLNELALAGVPTIVSPMHRSPRRHQLLNAQWYASQNAMRLCEEEGFNSQQQLEQEVAMLLESIELRTQLSANAQTLAGQQPATGLTDWILELLPAFIVEAAKVSGEPTVADTEQPARVAS